MNDDNRASTHYQVSVSTIEITMPDGSPATAEVLYAALTDENAEVGVSAALGLVRLCGPNTRSTWPRSSMARSSCTSPVRSSILQSGLLRVNSDKALVRKRPAIIGGAPIRNSPTAPFADCPAITLASSSASRIDKPLRASLRPSLLGIERRPSR